MADRPVLIAAASRPHPTETVNGDAWRADWRASGCRIAVVDGLGHGPGAAEAAGRALEALAAAPGADPVEAIRICHAALRATRGAAVGVAAIDLDAMRLTYAGVGNVEGRLLGAGRTERLVAQRGIVGATLPTLRAHGHALPPDWVLLVHTDGVRDRFDLDASAEAGAASPGDLAERLLADWGRPTDDATLLIAVPTAPPASPLPDGDG